MLLKRKNPYAHVSRDVYDNAVYLWVSWGTGLSRWYVALNRGPGNAVGSGRAEYGTKDCGHRWPNRCNSAFCGRWWCGRGFQRSIVGRIFGHRHGFRLWLGPAMNRWRFRSWRLSFRRSRIAEIW